MKVVIGFVLSLLAFNANAVVFNTLNGVDYEWLELTVTQGVSRDTVELRIADVNDVLYGYEYASRQLVEDLLLSYTSFDGVDGYHGAAGVLSGMAGLLSDFGKKTSVGDGSNSTYPTVDVGSVLWDYASWYNGLYGLDSECGINQSCRSHLAVYFDTNNTPTMAYQTNWYGWNAAYSAPEQVSNSTENQEWGSFLVKQLSPVPVPSAVCLFGSGLICLIGLARHKS